MKLPFKLRIVKYAIDENKPINAGMIHVALCGEYQEKQCNVKRIESILMTMLGIGIVKVDCSRFDDTGHLVTDYIITERGRSFSSMIP